MKFKTHNYSNNLQTHSNAQPRLCFNQTKVIRDRDTYYDVELKNTTAKCNPKQSYKKHNDLSP